jgi:phosphoribosylglycinamide formyltransferase 1
MPERSRQADPHHRPRLDVLLSGSGRTLMNVVDSIAAGRLHAEVALVIASRECLGLQRARDAQLPARLIPGDIPAPDLERTLREHNIDWVVLAGYLRLLNIPASHRGRVVNIHPALLPDFGGPGMYGRRVHEAVLRSGARQSGCTVHYCDEAYDTGAIILQKTCPVLPGDTPESLADRVHALECQAYPEALARLLQQHAVERTR